MKQGQVRDQRDGPPKGASPDESGDPGDREVLGKRRSRAYTSAMEAVFAIPIAMGIGWWADTKLDTAPWLMITGLCLGFAAFVLRLARMRGLVEAASSEPSDDEPS